MNVSKRWNKNKALKRIIMGLLCTGILCFSVLAEEDGPESNVWLDVIQLETEAQISVTVPLMYGFVVVGSVESDAKIPISTENGNLLLPNVRVAVTNPSGQFPNQAGGDAAYEIQFVSEPSFLIRNYSTDVPEGYEDEDIPPREGLPVKVKPYMISGETTTWLDQSIHEHYWKHSLTDPTWEEGDVETNFKKYQIILDDLPFSDSAQKYIANDNGGGKMWDVIWLKDEAAIALDAPPSVPDNGYTAAGTAKVPSEKYISTGVRVGGMQNQYKQVEESVKIGVIYWDVIPGELPEITP